jgi:hypothetical protein
VGRFFRKEASLTLLQSFSAKSETTFQKRGGGDDLQFLVKLFKHNNGSSSSNNNDNNNNKPAEMRSQLNKSTPRRAQPIRTQIPKELKPKSIEPKSLLLTYGEIISVSGGRRKLQKKREQHDQNKERSAREQKRKTKQRLPVAATKP